MFVPNEKTSFLHSFSSSSPKLDALDSGVRALNKTCDRGESREGVFGGGSNCNGAAETSRADTKLAISLCCDFLQFHTFISYRGRYKISSTVRQTF